MSDMMSAIGIEPTFHPDDDAWPRQYIASGTAPELCDIPARLLIGLCHDLLDGEGYGPTRTAARHLILLYLSTHPGGGAPEGEIQRAVCLAHTLLHLELMRRMGWFADTRLGPLFSAQGDVLPHTDKRWTYAAAHRTEVDGESVPQHIRNRQARIYAAALGTPLPPDLIVASDAEWMACVRAGR